MLQSIINTLYRHPKSQINIYRRFGGYFEYRRMLSNEQKMKVAANNINIKPPQSNLPSLNVCFLTGKKYWHQTVFCAYSLQKVCTQPIHFTFYDDGTLAEVPNIRLQIPNSTIVYIEEIENNLKQNLPIEKYPYLHKKRHEYKHIRKLTDVYSDGKADWKLMLDSDMLFWKEPTQMLQWLQNPQMPFYILDSDTAYGYDLIEMGKLSESTIKERINVGALGLCRQIVDFDKLEHWAKYLEQHFGTAYYLEQALSAMLIGDKESEIGLQDEYIVYPSENQVKNKIGTLHHYVDLSKKWYFRKVVSELPIILNKL